MKLMEFLKNNIVFYTLEPKKIMQNASHFAKTSHIFTIKNKQINKSFHFLYRKLSIQAETEERTQNTDTV